jgi:hypothetical protein
VDYSSTVDGAGEWGGKPLLASMIRMQLGGLLMHLSGQGVYREMVEEVGARVVGEGISKETIDRCIVAVLREQAIAYLSDRSIDEEKILAAVRKLASERMEHMEGLIALATQSGMDGRL